MLFYSSEKRFFFRAADSIAQTAMAEGSEATVLWELADVLPCLAPAALASLNSPQDVKGPRWRPEINETRLFASSPPYPDMAIVFYTFVWAGMVGHFIACSRGGLDASWTAGWHSQPNHHLRQCTH